MMTKLVVKAALAGVMLLANTAADGGCGPPPPSAPGPGNPGKPGAPKSCAMKLSKPPWTFKGTGGSDVMIRASVHVECYVPPKTHIMNVWLERYVKNSSIWIQEGDGVKSVTVPDGSGFDLAATYHGCISSKWRINARAKGISAAGTDFDVPLPDSETGETTIQCPGPR